MAEEELIEYIDDDEEDNSEELSQAQAELIERCKATGVEYEERETYEGEKFLTVGIPNGREKRWVPLFRLENYQRLLSTPFERYVFLGDYISIASYEDSSIEAMVRSVAPMGTSMVMRRMFGSQSVDFDNDENDKAFIELRPDGDDAEVTLGLGPATETMLSLSRGPFSRPGRLCLQVKGIQIDQHNKALSILEKLSNSLFFQIDMAFGVPLTLFKERRPTRGVRRTRREEDLNALQYPATEYDEAPMSLYWYARSAISMPLLQFLAFYQVIEFYFFSYSQEEARRKIRGILKDPTFRLDRDSDIARLLSSVNVKGRGFGDERSQLRATLNSCLTPEELRAFLTENEARKEFFTNKQKGLTNHKLALNNVEADLRNDVADLIYDIRCKIVHTKGDSNTKKENPNKERAKKR